MLLLQNLALEVCRNFLAHSEIARNAVQYNCRIQILIATSVHIQNVSLRSIHIKLAENVENYRCEA